MDANKRIEKKIAELMEIFGGLSENQLKVAQDLIKQSAFLSVTLEDLAEAMSNNGIVEEYKNGQNQHGKKLSTEAKLYNSLISKYTVIVTKLFSMIPEEHSATFEEYLKKHEEAHLRRCNAG